MTLLEMTAPLEKGLIVRRGAPHVTLMLVGFAARGRRLLRAAYRLIDAGERDAPVPFSGHAQNLACAHLRSR